MKKQENTFEIYKRLIKFIKPHLKIFILTLVSTAIYGASDGAIPYILKMVLDKIFLAKDQDSLWILVYGVILFGFVRGFFGFCQRYLSQVVSLRIVRDLRNEISSRLIYLPCSFFSEFNTGTLVSRMTNDTLVVKQAISDVCMSLVKDTIRVIVLVGAAFYLDPLLAVIVIVTVPIAIWPIMRFGKRVRSHSKSGQESFGDLTSVMEEHITGHKIVKAFSREKYAENKFNKTNQLSTRSLEKAAKYGSLHSPLNEVLAGVAIAGVLLYGGVSVIEGTRTQGDFIAFISSIFLLYEPIKKLGKLNTTLQSGVASANRIFDIIDNVPEDLYSGAKSMVDPESSLEFKDVSFNYNGEERSAIEGISFRLDPGKTVAFVGKSGSGKSTIVNLILRFYGGYKGDVLIGGEDIKDFSISSVRDAFSVVSQNTFLFNDTIYENIAYGNPSAKKEDVVRAAKIAFAHDFIEKMSNGYDTVVGQQGLKLSGGERARISIARAILKDAPYLILDEATANLDSESESIVHKAIESLMENRTSIVIAHRLSTVKNADEIIVLNEGKIVEHGKHQELLDTGGVYANLYSLQT